MIGKQKISFLKDIKKEKLNGKKVLMRVDYNVPLDENLQVRDNTRIVASLETIRYLLSAGSRIIIISHLGRPDGKVIEKLRLDPVARSLEGLLNKKVKKLDHCIGSEVEQAVNELKSGEIILLENLRFYPEEKQNEEGFAGKLARLADLYVNDAFGAAHRAHASISGVTGYLPSYAGFLIEKEIQALDKLINEPTRPFVSVVGGAKVSGKIEIIQKLIEICDTVMIGGGMAYTFLAAEGYEVGFSILEKDYFSYVNDLLKKAQALGKEILLPQDIVATREFKADAVSYHVPIQGIEKDMMGMDIGETTVQLFKENLKKAKTVFWNGPVGVFEMEKFSVGTNEIAKEIAALSGKAYSVVGGGDSIAAINKFKIADQFSHISTGGGASMEYLIGKELPGLEALKRI